MKLFKKILEISFSIIYDRRVKKKLKSTNKVLMKLFEKVLKYHFQFFHDRKLIFTANSLYLQTTKRLFTHQIITFDKKKK